MIKIIKKNDSPYTDVMDGRYELSVIHTTNTTR